MLFAKLAHALEPAHLLSEARRIRAKLRRRLRKVDEQIVTLEPNEPPRGRALFCYIIDPFLLASGEAVPHSHTHFFESLTMAHTFRELGFRVDALAWNHLGFEPRGSYDFFIDVRLQMERLAPRLPGALKVLHMETAHHSFHNPAQEQRLVDLHERRGFEIAPHKMIEPNRAIETTDVGTVLGNEFTQKTYAFAGKPTRRIRISAPFTYPWPEGKDFAAVRRRFLWFGSAGLVHKGLDLVLDAFAGMPDFELTVCGPIRPEKDFESAYFRELYQAPNIRTLGWVDVGPESFPRLAAEHLGLIYPSCSEGGGGCVLTCMHAALIPVASHEASVDLTPERGMELPGCSVEEIRAALRALSECPVAELEATARAAWEFAREHHTQETFRHDYRAFAEDLIEGRWPASG